MEPKELISGLNGFFDGLLVAFIIGGLGFISDKETFLLLAGVTLLISVGLAVVRYLVRD